jgi:hypothetical protein
MYASVFIGDELLADGGSGGVIWLFDRMTRYCPFTFLAVSSSPVYKEYSKLGF